MHTNAGSITTNSKTIDTEISRLLCSELVKSQARSDWIMRYTFLDRFEPKFGTGFMGLQTAEITNANAGLPRFFVFIWECLCGKILLFFFFFL